MIGSRSENRGIIQDRKVESGYDVYWAITHLIEEEHHGERLETGIIYFGS